MLKHKLVIKVDWRSKTPFCLIKSYSLCSVTLTYLTLQSVDAVKQTLNPRVIWIMHTFVSYITKLHVSIMKGQISTNQYMLSLKSWIKTPTSSNVGQARWEYLLNGT